MKHQLNPLNISFPKKLTVTEQEIDISLLTDSQKEFYIDLFKEVIQLYQSKKKLRLVVGVTGPAGSGKSVIAAIFHEIARQRPIAFRFESLGIDAFHFTNDFLISNTTDGEPLKNHKGRFDTYDVSKLTDTLTHFSLGHECFLPTYSRKTHNPIENAVHIKKGEPALLLVEGLWLLYDKNGWDKIGKILNFSIFIETKKYEFKQGVLERHIRGGKIPENAVEYYEANEAMNFELIVKTKGRANKVIPFYNVLE